jgi:hypothetical protein
MDCATVGLHLLAEMADGAVIKSLQNMSLALTRLGHFELAHAHAATRLQPDAARAHFWAATGAHKLHAYKAASYYLGQARCVHLGGQTRVGLSFLHVVTFAGCWHLCSVDVNCLRIAVPCPVTTVLFKPAFSSAHQQAQPHARDRRAAGGERPRAASIRQ